MSRRFRDEPDQATAKLTDDLVVYSFERFALEVVEGSDRGLRVESDGSEMAIGSSTQGNQLVLNDQATSRHHCSISAGPAGFVLTDLGSTNGIVIAGCKVEQATIKHGATFDVGRTTLRFDSLEDTVVEPISQQQHFGAVLGNSLAMRRIFAKLPKLASIDSTILIEGETGTGKTLLASAIHQASPRAAGPFVVVDCATMARTLIESQLFGHLRGAFTSASETRDGAFVAAHGGTVFLDEVGELPLDMQPKLLRVLEERVVTPIGSRESTPIDVRIIAATNRDLRQRVNSGEFRSDLFYRLHVINLTVPPLRDRPDDIAPLIRQFWSDCAPADTPLPQTILSTWPKRRWHGNVRELRAAIERLLLLGEQAPPEGPTAKRAGHISEDVDLNVPFRVAKSRILLHFESIYLGALIEKHHGNITRAAGAARMDRNHLRELLTKHDLLPPR